MRVVVAEDVMLTREGIARLLTDAGVEVAAAVGDAAALLRAVCTTQPDAAIVDIRMPPTHTDEGLAAAQQIRAGQPGVRRRSLWGSGRVSRTRPVRIRRL